MPIIEFEPEGLWLIPSLAYSIFCIWMMGACIYWEDDKDERISWATCLLLLGFFIAPFYYFKRYRPARALRRKEESARDLKLQQIISEYKNGKDA